MSSLNKVQLIGRVGRDPELKHWPSGDAFCDVSLATTETWKDKNTQEKKEATEWHRCAFSGRLAEVVAQYVRKGSLIYVEGSIKSRKYTKDGVEKTVVEIKGMTMQMLGGTPDAGGGQSQQRAAPAQRPAASKPATGGGDMDDDIPF